MGAKEKISLLCKESHIPHYRKPMRTFVARGTIYLVLKFRNNRFELSRLRHDICRLDSGKKIIVRRNVSSAKLDLTQIIIFEMSCPAALYRAV